MNNFRPQFTDEECITVYLWGISQRRLEQKTIYNYTKNHLLDWFPKLPSYQAFSNRLNRLAPAFQALAEYWLSIIGVNLQEQMEYIVDSCPIILAKGPRSGHAKIARELCEKAIILLEKSGIKDCQDQGRFTELMVRREAMKTMPFGEVWAEYCRHCGVPEDGGWYGEIQNHEAEVLSGGS